MKTNSSEKKLVLILFVLVFVIFSLAHEDSKKMEKGSMGINSFTTKNLVLLQQQTPKISPLSDSKDQRLSGQDE